MEPKAYLFESPRPLDGLVTALTYAVARERGEVTHRLMAEDLDIDD